jgi:hypothetical protein
VGLCHCRSYLSSSANRRLYSTGCLLDDQQFFIPQTPQSGYVCDISVTSLSGPPSLRPGACLIITHPAEWYPTHLGQEPILTELLGRFMTACRQIPWITKGNIPLWQLKAALTLKSGLCPFSPFFSTLYCCRISQYACKFCAQVHSAAFASQSPAFPVFNAKEWAVDGC